MLRPGNPVKAASTFFLKKGGACPAGSKNFYFFTLACDTTRPERCAHLNSKSFLVLFFKKELLSSFCLIGARGAFMWVRCF
jgi:hypothetical protein